MSEADDIFDLRVPPMEPPSREAERFVPAADIAAEALLWHRPQYLPRGVFVMLEGDAEEGKTFILADVAVDLAAGRMLFGVKTGATYAPIPVGYCTTEGSGANFKARLQKAAEQKGNPELADLVLLPNPDWRGPLFSLPDGVEQLDELVARYFQGGVLIIDPIKAFLERDLSDNSELDIRTQVTDHLSRIARERDCTIIALRHFRKAGGSAKARGGGSGAWFQAARLVWQVYPDPAGQGEDSSAASDQRILIVGKANDCLKPPAQAYGFGQTARPTDVTWIEWRGASSWTLHDLTEPIVGGGERKSGEAEWADALRASATIGWLPASEVMEAAARHLGTNLDADPDSSQRRMIKRARKRAGLDTKQEGNRHLWRKHA